MMADKDSPNPLAHSLTFERGVYQPPYNMLAIRYLLIKINNTFQLE